MMIERIIDWSVRKRWVIVFVTLLLCLWGSWSFLSLSIDAVPDITNVQVQVNAVSRGLSPEDLETKVTYPIEISMAGIPGVREVRSLTKFGLSQATVVFDDSTDIYRDRQLMNERLQTLSDLPPGVEQPTLSPITTGLGEIFHYTIQIENGADETSTLMRAKEIQEWLVKPRLLSVKGVAEVNTIGGYTRQLQVQPDLAQLARYRLNLSDLKEALQKTNRNAGGSYIRDGQKQLLVQASGQFRSLDEVRRVPVKSLQNLKNITIGDVAQVRFAGATRTGAALVNGKQAVLGTVMMLSGSNSRTVARAVSERIEEIQKSNELPASIKIVPLYDRSDLVDATLETVIHNLVVGAALVIVILFLLLGNFKAALTVSISIPVTLLATFGFMRLFGISGNLMSLGALDFGIIVDGAVIVVDHCVSWIQDRSNRAAVLDKVIGASHEIRSAAGFGQIMVIVVFVPIIGLGGIEGKMFRPMAETFSIALGVALLLSFTLIPALAAIFFNDRESDSVPWVMRQIERIYVPTLEIALRWRWAVIGASMALVVAGFMAFGHLGAEFLPKLDEGSLILQMLRPTDASLEASVAYQSRSEAALLKFGAVQGVFSRIGTPDVATDPMGPNESDTFIQLKDRKDWIDSGVHFYSKEKMVEAMMTQLQAAVPGQELSATQPIQMRFNDMLEGTRADLTVKVYGESLGELKHDTTALANLIRSIAGAGDVQTEFRGGIPLLDIEPRLDVLSRFSLSASPVLDAVSIGMAGEPSGYFYEGLRRIPLLVKLGDSARNDPESLKRIQVFAGDNLTVPLAEVASFRKLEVLSPILREGSKRRSAVLINPRGRDVESFVRDAQDQIARKIQLSPGNRIEWFGSFKNLEDAKQRLLILGPLALLLVTAMIYWAFGSVVETLIVLATVPLALVGGVFGLSVTAIPFSISAAVGFIALSGIAVLNGVVLVHYFKVLRKDPRYAGGQWIIRGSTSRLRAVLMTALVDVFGFIPMALSSGLGAEVQKPLAMVVIGGVITSTALTLVVLPVVSSILIKET